MIRKPLLSAMAMFAAFSASADEPAGTAYDFSFTSIEGEPLPFSDFEGKVVLVVNTASFCGFTRQYEDLQAVWEKYRDDSFVMLGVPSNDFGNQEPGTEAEIRNFCEVNYDLDFPMTTKVSVKGDDAHPFYKWAADRAGFAGKPRWNFHKYLIGPEGQLLDWFSSPTKPTSTKVTIAIEEQLRLLAAKSG